MFENLFTVNRSVVVTFSDDCLVVLVLIEYIQRLYGAVHHDENIVGRGAGLGLL